MKRTSAIGTLLALCELCSAGCADDVPVGPEDPSTGTTTVTATTMSGPSDATTSDGSSDSTGLTSDPDSGSTGPVLPPPMPAGFVVTIENVSSAGLMSSPLSPGMWANHEADADVLFSVWAPDDGEGLEMLAEDGEPSALARSVAGHPGVLQTGTFDTPQGTDGPAPLLPGEAYQFTLTAEPGTRLSLATMLMGSNDLVVATAPPGLSLFSGGLPLSERDVSSALQIYDAGTERNQAPGQGPWQALHGGSPDVGPAEVPGVQPHEHSTRAIPLGPDLVSVTVDEDPEDPTTLIVTLTNVSWIRGTLVTPLSGLVWALHDDSVRLFTEGAPASPELEALAEDGDPTALQAMLASTPGVGQHGAIDGPFSPGDSIVIAVSPSPDAPRLSLVTMVMESNDAFLAVGPSGVPLLDGVVLRSEDELEEELAAAVTPWDAGTEANEVPGVGPTQALRQGSPDTGADDLAVPGVQRYVDVTDDLAGPGAGGLLSVGVAEDGGSYTITITNVSEGTAFPGVLGPLVWAVHDDTVRLFELGIPASPGLQFLAEDAQPGALLAQLLGTGGVTLAGVQDVIVGPGLPTVGPLQPGDAYELVVTPDPLHRFLSVAAMIMPSNDTFAAVEPQGVALLDARGVPRPAVDVAADLAAGLRAWDAGTEGDQAGAAGRDMAPSGVQDSGPGLGNGLVRAADEDEIWSVPQAQGLIRVIVAPVP